MLSGKSAAGQSPSKRLLLSSFLCKEEGASDSAWHALALLEICGLEPLSVFTE